MNGPRKKTLGTTNKRAKFNPPTFLKDKTSEDQDKKPPKRRLTNEIGNGKNNLNKSANIGHNVEELMNDNRMKNIEPKMAEMIMNEIMDKGLTVTWDDIAGLDHAKNTITEIVIWPMQRPDLFHGLRGPPKGLLLFGPPGTGKTLIGKCIASQSKATFFSISSSSLTSKWIGDGEKMVRALFAVARVFQPSVIFLDEIDSLLTHRSDGEVEATRRLKTEFLVQFDGCGTNSEDRILLIGATNRYIPLPEFEARRHMIHNVLQKYKYSSLLSDEDVDEITKRTDGYSGSDMDGLIREASMGPIRDIRDLATANPDDVRPIVLEDFIQALTQVRASVSDRDLEMYLKFDSEYGSFNKPQ
ncbi:hypothetical protein HK096_005144 [Nowakowskiella sp. JEL0078]|nr:hypothetical protein HK096_005144 [Nowakowskiella sp. JEL0078]